MTASFAEPALELSGGARLPLLGIGTWRLSGRSATQAISWALDAGYRHIDTATGYGNETEVGKALRDSGLSRTDVFITTKLPPSHVGRERRTLDESLAALGTDHVDLWLVHWPPGGQPGVSTWERFVYAREEGLARAIGVSNYSLDQIDTLIAATGVTPEVNQIRWSPLLYDADILSGHRERGIVVEGYSPFRAGTLSHPALIDIAARHGKGPAQVVIRWHIQHEVVVIPKSARHDRVVSNADVFDFELSAEEMKSIDALAR